MSGYLDALIANTDDSQRATSAFDKAVDFQNKQYQIGQGRAVDAAVRAGVGQMLDQGGSAYAAPRIGAGVSASQPVAPVQHFSPAGGPSFPATQATMPQDGSSDWGPNNRLAMVEQNPAAAPVNPQGYGGKYSFGTEALQDIGVWQPALGTGKNDWRGTVTVPGFAPMTAYQFWQNEPAQDAAMNLRRQWLQNQAQSRGLTHYVGTNVGGVDITNENLTDLMHFAGPANVQRWLDTGGQFDFRDGNGVSIPQYANRLENAGVSRGPMPSSGSIDALYQSLGNGTADVDAANPPDAVGGFDPSTRFNPILRQLANTPGGGDAALKLLDQQSRYGLGLLGAQNRYNMAMVRRSDTYQRLAMQALAHGDPTTFQYYAGLGGVNIPPEIMQNAGAAQRLGRAALVAERLYGSDKQGASRFTQAYIATGDLGAAIQQAGPPAENPHVTFQQLYDAATNTMQLYGFTTTGPNAGTAFPALGPNGLPVVADPKPAAGVQSQNNRVKLLVQAGFPPAEAAQYAAGVGLKPADALRAFTSLANSIRLANPGLGDKPDGNAQIERMADAEMTAAFGPNWRPTGMGGLPRSSPAVVPAVPAPTAATSMPSTPAAPVAAPSPVSPPSSPAPQGGGVQPPPQVGWLGRNAPTWLGRNAPTWLGGVNQPAAAAGPLPAPSPAASGAQIPAAPPAIGAQSGMLPATGAQSALPPAALSQLKEGVRTTFRNGQVWTLRNGMPVQISNGFIPGMQ